MTPDTTTFTPRSTVGHGTAVRADSPNAAAIDAIRAHHAHLAEQLRVRTDAVATAARSGACTAERDALHRWYDTELMPHAMAEEEALYGPAAQFEPIRLLIDGLLIDHRFLASLVADLARATDALEVVSIAAAAQATFTVHLSKENDLLLPALDQAGLELPRALDGMHTILGAGHEGAGRDAGGAQAASAEFAVRSEETEGELDVRALPHGQRHEVVFARLDALAPGHSLVIVNDHDPKPLRYQISAMWPSRFEWTYQEAGPALWRVAISRVS